MLSKPDPDVDAWFAKHGFGPRPGWHGEIIYGRSKMGLPTQKHVWVNDEMCEKDCVYYKCAQPNNNAIDMYGGDVSICTLESGQRQGRTTKSQPCAFPKKKSKKPTKEHHIKHMLDVVDKEGLYYAFVHYSNFSEVEDKKLERLATRFRIAASKLSAYLNKLGQDNGIGIYED